MCHALLQTGVAGIPQEYLLHLKTQDGPAPELHGRQFDEFNCQMQKKGTSENGVFALKTMWADLQEYLRRYRLTAAAPLTELGILLSAFPNPVFVYIFRRDKICQAVSMAKAIQTGEYFRLKGIDKRAPDHAPLLYDEVLLLQHYTRLLKEDYSWQQFFVVNRLTPFSIAYEELIGDYKHTLAELLNHLEIPSDRLMPLEESKLLKQADEINFDWSTRFRDYLRCIST